MARSSYEALSYDFFRRGYTNRFFGSLHRTPSVPVVGGFFSVKVVGYENFINSLGLASRYSDRIMRNALKKLLEVVEIILPNLFAYAALKAGHRAFPNEYLQHIRKVLRDNGPTIIYGKDSAGSLELVVDFDALGTKDDLTVAYHRGAILKEGGQVLLPWTGGENDSSLRSDVLTRYAFFTSMIHGEPFESESGALINTSGLWEATVRDRVLAWDLTGKAPEWLLLQYGQTEWAPTIQPFPIVETVAADLEFALYEILEFFVERTVSIVYGAERRTAYSREGSGEKSKAGKVGSHLSRYRKTGAIGSYVTTTIVQDAIKRVLRER